MLIEFSVKNFLSFRDEVIFSLEKGNGDENSNNIIKTDIGEFLKSGAIYGANASGKSNLLKALTCAILMVRNSNSIPIDGKWNLIKPFMFDDINKNKPSEFRFVFFTNNRKYIYYFSADSKKVYNESLDVYYSQKPTSIFKRKNINEYEFTYDKATLLEIAKKNTDNKLFLSTATTWNYEKTKDAFIWFTKSIDTYASFENISNIDLINYSKNADNIVDFATKLLSEADILIKNIKVDYKEEEMNDSMANSLLPQIVKNSFPSKLLNVNIEMTHEVVDDNNTSKYYDLNINDESYGTKVLFALAPFLKRAFDETKVIVVDEIERSLHPSLVEFLIKLFNNNKINKVNSQLIFTTHATNLLNLELLRRDQIWFTEKNTKNGVSDLYALDSFSVRKTENIQKGYINGRYGAIPFIRDIDLWAEELNK